MSEEELKRLIQKQPFQPVRLHLTTGETFEVRYLDAILVGPRSTALLVGGVMHFLANLHIAHVEELSHVG
jgi:hypothetical protein